MQRAIASALALSCAVFAGDGPQEIGGGVAGHNGLRSVSSALGTNDFQRVRIGIGRPPGRMQGAAFVLATFTSAEWREVPTICEQAADATGLLVAEGLEPAQNTVHDWG